MTSLTELNQLRAMFEKNLEAGHFSYEEWTRLADMFPEGSKARKDLRKKAARIAAERKRDEQGR